MDGGSSETCGGGSEMAAGIEMDCSGGRHHGHHADSGGGGGS